MRRLIFFLARCFWLSATALFVVAAAVSLLRFTAAIALLLLALWWRGSRWRGSGSAQGTARHASLTDLAYAGMLGGNGLILGRASLVAKPTRSDAIRLLWSPRWRSDLAVRLCIAAFGAAPDDGIIRVQKYTHMATFAGTGRGKGVSTVILNVLAYPLGLVIIDIKSEIFHATAKHRRRRFGHAVLVLDPFGLSGEPTSILNALDFIDEHALDFLDQCRDLADSLVVVTGTEPDPHWNQSARVIITAFIAFVCACEPDPAKRTLRTVRYLLASRQRFFKAMRLMQEEHGFGSVIRELGHQLSWYTGEELGSVLTTVARHTEWMDSPAVAAVLSDSSTFDPRSLRSGRLTVHLILPPERLSSLAGLMRMWVGTLLRVSTRGVPDETSPILFMLDEFGHLGHMQAIEDAVTLMRGYGIRLWFIWQSIGQVKKNFGERAGIVLDNIDTQQYFGINSYESAEAISRRGGDATILIESLNRTRSRSRPECPTVQDGGSTSESTSLTLSEHGRALYRPDELIRLPDDMALVFHRNLPVIPVQLIRYYDAPEFRKGGIGQPRGWGIRALFIAVLAFISSVLLASIATLTPISPPSAPHLPPPSPIFRGDGGGFDRRAMPDTRPGVARPPLQPLPYVPPGGLYPQPTPHGRRGMRRHSP